MHLNQNVTTLEVKSLHCSDRSNSSVFLRCGCVPRVSSSDWNLAPPLSFSLSSLLYRISLDSSSYALFIGVIFFFVDEIRLWDNTFFVFFWLAACFLAVCTICEHCSTPRSLTQLFHAFSSTSYNAFDRVLVALWLSFCVTLVLVRVQIRVCSRVFVILSCWVFSIFYVFTLFLSLFEMSSPSVPQDEVEKQWPFL